MTQYGIDKNGANCKDIRPHLKDIDRLFDIAFDYNTEQYIIYFNGNVFQNVPWHTFDQRVINTLRKVYWTNVNGDPFEEMDRHNERIDQANENKRADMIHEITKDIHKAILKEF